MLQKPLLLKYLISFQGSNFSEFQPAESQSAPTSGSRLVVSNRLLSCALYHPAGKHTPVQADVDTIIIINLVLIAHDLTTLGFTDN